MRRVRVATRVTVRVEALPFRASSDCLQILNVQCFECSEGSEKRSDPAAFHFRSYRKLLNAYPFSIDALRSSRLDTLPTQSDFPFLTAF